MPDLDLKREMEILKPHLFILIFFFFCHWKLLLRDYKQKIQLLGAIVYRIECEEVSKNVLERS